MPKTCININRFGKQADCVVNSYGIFYKKLVVCFVFYQCAIL